jgi:L-threonylcarbamoyladenylate synthase
VNDVHRVWISADRLEPGALAEAADVLARGGLVAYPTDTLYGLAADPRSAAAVARVYGVKGRPAGEALPLIASSLEQVQRDAGRLSALAMRLAARFWPGPLTLIIEASPTLVPAVHAGTGAVAVRVPDHRVARDLADAAGFPVTSTSANRSGEPAPALADEVVRTIGGEIDLVLDGGPAPGGLPSTIVDARFDRPRLVRAGAVPFDRVLEVV